MIQTFLIAVAVFAISVAAMAIGALMGKGRIRGTCGGLANLRDTQGSTICDACSDPQPECTGKQLEESQRPTATIEA